MFSRISLLMIFISLLYVTCYKAEKRNEEKEIYYSILLSYNEHDKISCLEDIGVDVVGNFTFLSPQKGKYEYRYVILNNGLLSENAPTAILYNYGKRHRLFAKSVNIVDSLEAKGVLVYSSKFMNDSLEICVMRKKDKVLLGCDFYKQTR